MCAKLEPTRSQGLSIKWVGLEGRTAVKEAHLARIEEGIGIESQRIKEIEEFEPGSDSPDAKIKEYDDAIKITEDAASDSRLLSDHIRESHDGIAGKIDELRSKMKEAAYASLVVRKAVLLCEMGRYEEAMECLKGAPGRHDSSDIAVRISMALTKAGMYAEAWEWVGRAIKMTPDHVGAAYNTALLEDEDGEYYKASDKLDWILDARRNGEQRKGMPDLDAILLHKGLVHAHEGDHKSAIECYDEVIRIRPGDPDAAYHKAESLYRSGACTEAAEWFGRAAGHMDADARRNRIIRMQDGPEERVLLALLVIETSGGIHGMPHLQHSVFLAQRDLGIQAYDFAGRGFGPYSRDLVEDVSANTGLFTVGGGWNHNPSEPRTYSITGRGRDILEESGWLDKDVTCNTGTAEPDLIDAVYSKFHGKLGSDVEADVSCIIAGMGRGDGERPHTHGWAGAQAEFVKHVLSNIGPDTMPSTRSAVLNIAGIIADNCSEIERFSRPPVDHYGLEGALSSLCEYGNILMKYSEIRNVVKYPNLSNGLEGIMC